MEIGGLVLHSFKIIFGNPDVMFILVSIAITLTIMFTSIVIYQNTKY